MHFPEWQALKVTITLNSATVTVWNLPPASYRTNCLFHYRGPKSGRRCCYLGQRTVGEFTFLAIVWFDRIEMCIPVSSSLTLFNCSVVPGWLWWNRVFVPGWLRVQRLPSRLTICRVPTNGHQTRRQTETQIQIHRPRRAERPHLQVRTCTFSNIRWHLCGLVSSQFNSVWQKCPSWCF